MDQVQVKNYNHRIQLIPLFDVMLFFTEERIFFNGIPNSAEKPFLLKVENAFRPVRT